ncbi:hypothetical protein PMIN05_011574 [Paraphaeosphaeria minitans]
MTKAAETDMCRRLLDAYPTAPRGREYTTSVYNERTQREHTTRVHNEGYKMIIFNEWYLEQGVRACLTHIPRRREDESTQLEYAMIIHKDNTHEWGFFWKGVRTCLWTAREAEAKCWPTYLPTHRPYLHGNLQRETRTITRVAADFSVCIRASMLGNPEEVRVPPVRRFRWCVHG